MRQISIAFQIWRNDNDSKFPMDIPASMGGAREMMATGNVAACFQIMSNELSTPRSLLCPQDFRHEAATNFANFSSANLSYFLALTLTDTNVPQLLLGDANLVRDGVAVPSGILDLRAKPAAWSRDRHQGFGNILLSDGEIAWGREVGFTNSTSSHLETNSVVVP